MTSTDRVDVSFLTGLPAYLDGGISRPARRYHLGRALHGQDASTCDRLMVDYAERWGYDQAREDLDLVERDGIDLPDLVRWSTRRHRWR